VEILESIPRDQMPASTRPSAGSIWASLAERVINDHLEGRVTVVSLADQKEVERMRGGMAHRLKRDNWKARTVVQRNKDGIRVYIDLVSLIEEPPESVVTRPIKRIRLGGNRNQAHG